MMRKVGKVAGQRGHRMIRMRKYLLNFDCKLMKLYGVGGVWPAGAKLMHDGVFRNSGDRSAGFKTIGPQFPLQLQQCIINGTISIDHNENSWGAVCVHKAQAF